MGKKFALYNNPADLDEDSLLEYKEAVSRYPYCQYARLMFLLNLKQADDRETYRLALPSVAISLPDRIRLKEQVDRLQVSVPEPAPVRPKTETLPKRHAESFSPWSQALPQPGRIRETAPENGQRQDRPPFPRQSEQKEEQLLIRPESPGFTPVVEKNPIRKVNVDEVRTLLNKPRPEKTEPPRPKRPVKPSAETKSALALPKQESSGAKSWTPLDGHSVHKNTGCKTNDIIDRFLSSGAEHPIALDDTFDYASFDPDTGKSTQEDFSFGSETLAEMYLRNNTPHKAIAVYEHLGLKFPEKSRYFADLIRKVKKDYSIN